MGEEDRSDARSAGIFEVDGPIGRTKRRFILTTDQSDAGSVDIFSRRTNRTHEARVYSRDGPMSSHLRRTEAEGGADVGASGTWSLVNPADVVALVHIHRHPVLL
eukprot:7917269-Pyramimonas_sp.AAC.1